MGYEAICDLCQKRLPRGEFLHNFVIGYVYGDMVEDQKWGELCSPCYDELYSTLLKVAEQLKKDYKRKTI